jgi:hypothetical protein
MEARGGALEKVGHGLSRNAELRGVRKRMEPFRVSNSI